MLDSSQVYTICLSVLLDKNAHGGGWGVRNYAKANIILSNMHIWVAELDTYLFLSLYFLFLLGAHIISNSLINSCANSLRQNMVVWSGASCLMRGRYALLEQTRKGYINQGGQSSQREVALFSCTEAAWTPRGLDVFILPSLPLAWREWAIRPPGFWMVMLDSRQSQLL